MLNKCELWTSVERFYFTKQCATDMALPNNFLPKPLRSASWYSYEGGKQCHQKWQNFTTLVVFQILGVYLFSIWQNFEPTLVCFHLCKWPKIWKTNNSIWSHLRKITQDIIMPLCPPFTQDQCGWCLYLLRVSKLKKVN